MIKNTHKTHINILFCWFLQNMMWMPVRDTIKIWSLQNVATGIAVSVCWRFHVCMYLHISHGSFLGRLPSEASLPIIINYFYMHILKEFRTNRKLREMKRNNPLIYFTLLRRQHILVPYFNTKMIWGKELYLIFTMHPQGLNAGLSALQLPNRYLPTNFKYLI